MIRGLSRVVVLLFVGLLTVAWLVLPPRWRETSEAWAGSVGRGGSSISTSTSSSPAAPANSKRTSYLHLIVPATSSNENLCKLLLSTTALKYPPPVFVNWGATEEADPYKQHLAKVGGILEYLDKLPDSRQDDIVLIVDGYDVWFQLGPDVLLSRYFKVIDAANRRLQQRFGRRRMLQHDLRQSVIFGPDKICWPENRKRAAFWAVPDSTLPRYAFGPDTDSGRWREHNRARWLNSGTIMGPIRDIQRLLEATAARVRDTNTSIISDQYHMANIFGQQELTRSLLLGETPPLNRSFWIADDHDGGGHQETVTLEVPDTHLDGRDEFHITIDYESELFQTTAFYWKYLDWLRAPLPSSSSSPSTDQEKILAAPKRLPDDILASPPPFAGLAQAHAHSKHATPAYHAPDPSRNPRPVGLEIPRNVSWADVRLGTNTVSGHVFPIVHFTPPKEYLEVWWHDMWFFSYGEAVIAGANSNSNAHARAASSAPLLTTEDQRVWRPWQAFVADDARRERFPVGAADDRGGWLAWSDVCQVHEPVVFGNARRPPPREEDEKKKKNPPPNKISGVDSLGNELS